MSPIAAFADTVEAPRPPKPFSQKHAIGLGAALLFPVQKKLRGRPRFGTYSFSGGGFLGVRSTVRHDVTAYRP